MKGFSSKRIAPKIDVTGPENIPFAGASAFHPGKFTGGGSEGVNVHRGFIRFMRDREVGVGEKRGGGVVVGRGAGRGAGWGRVGIGYLCLFV